MRYAYTPRQVALLMQLMLLQDMTTFHIHRTAVRDRKDAALRLRTLQRTFVRNCLSPRHATDCLCRTTPEPSQHR